MTHHIVTVSTHQVVRAFEQVRSSEYCVITALQDVLASFYLIATAQNAIEISKGKVEVSEEGVCIALDFV